MDLLKRLGGTAASLANNHSADLGRSLYSHTISTLEREGISVITQGRVSDLGTARVFGLTEVTRAQAGGPAITVQESDFDDLRNGRHVLPLMAFLHWGRQYDVIPGAEQRELAQKLMSLGVSTIVGAHPHVAVDSLFVLAGGATLVAYTLGNFLFDQRDPCGSGSILEVYRFTQGTVYVRLVSHPNIYQVLLRDRGPTSQRGLRNANELPQRVRC